MKSPAGRTPLFVVTGATGSIGAAVAAKLARTGTVVLVCRDRARGEEAVARASRASGHDRAELVLCDFADLPSVRAAAMEIRSRHAEIDVLVNVASVFRRYREVTRDGYERMFQVNQLAPFLFTRQLLPALQAAAPARVITVTAPSTFAPDFEDLNGERRFSAYRTFGATKFENLLFGFSLADRLDRRSVTSNLVHPGLVRSGLMNDAPSPLRWVLNLVSRPAEKAADSIAWMALDPSLEGVSGRFFKDRAQIPAPRRATEPELQRLLWDQCERMTASAPGMQLQSGRAQDARGRAIH